MHKQVEDSHIDGWKHAECVKRVCQRYITGLKTELAELTRKASEAWFDNGYLHAENKDLKTQLATLRTLIADYQKAGDSAKELEAQNKALRAEVERLTIQHDEMAAQIMDADVLGMKYKEECERLKVLNEDLGYTITHGCMKYAEDGTTVIDKCPMMKENERLKIELAACRASDAFVDSLRADKLKLADENKRLEHELGVMRGVYNSMSGTLETIRDDCATRIGENCQLVARLCNATMATAENKMEVEGVNRG
jgi:regulator of replication initiation timing